MLFVVERDNTLVVCEKDGCIVEGFDHLVARVLHPFPFYLEANTTANKGKKLSFSKMYEKKKVSEEKKEKKRQTSISYHTRTGKG